MDWKKAQGGEGGEFGVFSLIFAGTGGMGENLKPLLFCAIVNE